MGSERAVTVNNDLKDDGFTYLYSKMGTAFMMQTDRLGLPLLAAGQAQKEMTHNEALTMLDLAIALTVERDDLSAPPSSPGAGLCWIIGDGASGEWSGREGQIAGWTEAGWRFLLPHAGMGAWHMLDGHMLRFEGAAWVSESVRPDGFYIEDQRVVGPRGGAIPDASGGANQDVEARVSINLLLAALRNHGLID